jgi:hypothetical protein
VTTVSLTLLRTQVLLDLPHSLAERIRHLYAANVQDHLTATESIRITVTSEEAGGRVVGCGPPIIVADELTAISHLLSRINGAVLTASPYLGIHAGVVAANGRAVAFPAASGVGKSTLVAACLQAGMSYVSDEALCLDWTTGDLVPYPRPIGLSDKSCRLLGLTPDPVTETALSAAMLGAKHAATPLQLSHLVLLNESNTGLEPVSRNVGVAELLKRSFNHWHQPERAFELAHDVTREASVWRMGRGTPANAACRIAALTRSSHSSQMTYRHRDS